MAKTRIRELWDRVYVKRFFFVALIVCVWGIVFRLEIFPPILFPSPAAVFSTLVSEIGDGSMLIKVGNSLYMVITGIAISLVFVLIIMVFAMVNKTVRELAGTLISVLDPLPGIALLPLAILWFGIGQGAILFVMVHSILWPVILNVMKGFDTVPLIYREVGMSVGVSKVQMLIGIYVPAAFPSILAGLKTGWSRAWRALIGAEMVFGAIGDSAGLGWDIYLKRSFLDMPGMFATLIMIMIIGILIEDLFFRRIEKATIVKWGMVK